MVLCTWPGLTYKFTGWKGVHLDGDIWMNVNGASPLTFIQKGTHVKVMQVKKTCKKTCWKQMRAAHVEEEVPPTQLAQRCKRTDGTTVPGTDLLWITKESRPGERSGSQILQFCSDHHHNCRKRSLEVVPQTIEISICMDFSFWNYRGFSIFAKVFL